MLLLQAQPSAILLHTVEAQAVIKQQLPSNNTSKPMTPKYVPIVLLPLSPPPPFQNIGNQYILYVAKFDIFDWYPKYESCQRYFIEHAQASAPVQALAAFINITLPFQRPTPISPSSPRLSPTPSHHPRPPHQSHTSVSLIPYLRRLIITGLDNPGVLHGFFGDDWTGGVGPLHEQERRNYLFAAKSGGWASVKQAYDMGTYETVPFMRPLQTPLVEEIEGAEKSWSEWLAMEDWMVGPRAPERMEEMGQGGGGGHGHGGGGMERGRGR